MSESEKSSVSPPEGSPNDENPDGADTSAVAEAGSVSDPADPDVQTAQPSDKQEQDKDEVPSDGKRRTSYNEERILADPDPNSSIPQENSTVLKKKKNGRTCGECKLNFKNYAALTDHACNPQPCKHCSNCFKNLFELGNHKLKEHSPNDSDLPESCSCSLNGRRDGNRIRGWKTMPIIKNGGLAVTSNPVSKRTISEETQSKKNYKKKKIAPNSRGSVLNISDAVSDESSLGLTLKDDYIKKSKYTCKKCGYFCISPYSLKQHIEHTCLKFFRHLQSCVVSVEKLTLEKDINQRPPNTSEHEEESPSLIRIKQEKDDLLASNDTDVVPPHRYSCSHCQETFDEQSSLEFHVVRKHPQLVGPLTSCQRCGEKFSSIIAFNMHSCAAVNSQTAEDSRHVSAQSREHSVRSLPVLSLQAPNELHWKNQTSFRPLFKQIQTNRQAHEQGRNVYVHSTNCDKSYRPLYSRKQGVPPLIPWNINLIHNQFRSENSSVTNELFKEPLPSQTEYAIQIASVESVAPITPSNELGKECAVSTPEVDVTNSTHGFKVGIDGSMRYICSKCFRTVSDRNEFFPHYLNNHNVKVNDLKIK